MNETTDASAIFAPFLRFKWMILIVGLLVALGTYIHYDNQTPSYGVSTIINTVNGLEEQGIPPPEPRKRGKQKTVSPAQPSANVINSPVIHGIVAAELRGLPGAIARDALRGSVSAKAAENSYIITIAAQAASGPGAALLANTTAATFATRQNTAYTQSVAGQIAVTKQQLNADEVALAANPNPVPAAAPPPVVGHGKRAAERAEQRGNANSLTLQAASLANHLNALRAQLPIQSVKQQGIANGRFPVTLSANPKTNAIFGFVIGVFLACVAAYTLNRFDRRVRTLAGIESVFQAPVLAALPRVRHPIVRHNGYLAPTSPLSEPLRRLHTTLRLAQMLERDRGGGPRSILFLSPDAADGKSTVAAGLALVQRDAGEHVSLIEADFRRPVQARLLDTALNGGLLEVLTGELTLEEAMQLVDASAHEHETEEEEENGAHDGVGGLAASYNSRNSGALSVLLGARGVANPPAVLAEPAMAAIVEAVVKEFDHVLIDAPPPLLVSDILPLLAAVDGIVLVARLGHTREASARRLIQLLTQTPSAPVVGVVANDVSRGDMSRFGFTAGYGYKYGYGSAGGYGEESWLGSLPAWGWLRSRWRWLRSALRR